MGTAPSSLSPIVGQWGSQRGARLCRLEAQRRRRRRPPYFGTYLHMIVPQLRRQ
jgi:hypothetical protein